MIYCTQEDFVQPILQYNAKQKLWRLVEDYTMEWGEPGFRKRLIHSAGREYDKASVPKLLRNIAEHDGVWEGPSFWHDSLYANEGLFPHLDTFRFETKSPFGEWKVDPSKWRRKDMDKLLKESGIWAGARPTQANLYETMVKIYPVNWFKPF